MEFCDDRLGALPKRRGDFIFLLLEEGGVGAEEGGDHGQEVGILAIIGGVWASEEIFSVALFVEGRDKIGGG